MISTTDRQDAIQLIDEGRAQGARLQSACAELGIGTNTYRRWVRGDQDRRPQAVRRVSAGTGGGRACSAARQRNQFLRNR